jgi:hypothetical protein
MICPALFMLVSSATTLASQEVTLARPLEPRVETYLIEYSHSIKDESGEKKTTASWEHELRILGVDPAKKEASVDLSIRKRKYESDSPFSDVPPKEEDFKGLKLSPSNRLYFKENEKRDRADGLPFMFWQPLHFLELSGGALKIGDSWDVTLLRTNTFGPAPTKVKAKLIGDAEFEGKPAWHVKVDEPKRAIDYVETASDGSSMHCQGTVRILVDAHIDKATGRPLVMDTFIEGDLLMVFPGGEFDWHIKTTGKMKLKDVK